MIAEYSFLTLNVSGVVDTVTVVKLRDDDSAQRHAREMAHAGRVEVWAGKRKVAVVPPLVDRRGGDRRMTDTKTPGR